MKFNLAENRSIKKLDYKSPILVPSFSSKGFPNLNILHNYLKDRLTNASLISTYDLHYNYLDSNSIYESNLLIIDSGGYERNQDHDISEIYNSFHAPHTWNLTLYEKQVKLLSPVTDILLVNYDFEDGIELKKQIALAKKQFSNYPEFAHDFLCKPFGKETIIDIDYFINNIHELNTFDVIGFTEKELGNSIYQRAKNIYKLRLHLNKCQLDIPIHIFGCLDPISITLYFLCGADIFDGLSWLRFSFNDGKPIYFNHYALSSGNWRIQDSEIKMLACIENLDILAKLQENLKKFARSGYKSSLNLTDKEYREIQSILSKIYYDLANEEALI